VDIADRHAQDLGGPCAAGQEHGEQCPVAVAAQRGEQVLDDIVGDRPGLAVDLLLPLGAPAVQPERLQRVVFGYHYTVIRQATLYLRSSSRIVMPARWSRRIAAYSSTFDICGMTRAFHREHPDAVLASTSVLTKLGFWLNFCGAARPLGASRLMSERICRSAPYAEAGDAPHSPASQKLSQNQTREHHPTVDRGAS
jgi:hypothetical protein